MPAFIHSDAIVLGDVVLGDRASIWPTAVLRADCARISIGDETSIQDGAVLHVDHGVPCTIGRRVTVGHRAIVHGATVEDECMIGMGAIVLNHAVIGRGSLVGAGALVPEGTVIPPDSVVLGIPARIMWQVSDEARARMVQAVNAYLDLQERHLRGEVPRRSS